MHSSAPTQNSIHVIDAAIQQIAEDFRFTISEVQEYYDGCGEMTKTRRRFQKMRDKITEYEDDDQ